MLKKITIEVSDTTHKLLEVLTKGDCAPRTVEGVVEQLVDPDWTQHLEPGDR